MNELIETKIVLDKLKLALYEKAVVLQDIYKMKHEEKNSRLPYKKRGWVGFRVRQSEGRMGLSVSIEWYKLTYMNNKSYSQGIKKGVKGGALLNNIKRCATRWEYDLVLDIVEELRPVEVALNDVSKMMRIYQHAVKSLNENTYLSIGDIVDNPYVVHEIDWENDPIPDWYEE